MAPVAGYVGADVPVELLTAAGYLPRRLSGSPDDDAETGRRYLGGGLDPVACSILTRLLAGAYGPLDLLVVSHDCEASLRLFYALRELARVTPEVDLPPLHLVDVLHLPHRTTTRYDLAQVRRFRSWLAERGTPVPDDALARAVAAHDDLRSVLRQVGLQRARRVLTGTELLGLVDLACTRPVDEARARVRDMLAELPGRPPLPGTPVVVTGSSHDTPHVYAALEAHGLLVVGEDHDRGDLLALGDVGAPTELALAERYQAAGPAAAHAAITERAAHTARLVRDRGAVGLLAYVRRHDDGPRWDVPAQRGAAGVPTVLVDHQEYGRIDGVVAVADALRGAVAA